MVHSWGKYFQKVHSKWKPFEKSNWKYYPCPGCNMHEEIIGSPRAEVLFRNYCDKYPQSAYGLYWRSHPDEYKKLMELVNRRKGK